MTILVAPTDSLYFNYSATPTAGNGYSSARKQLYRFTLIQKMGVAANGTATIERGVALREGQVKKLIRKHTQRHGYPPRRTQGGGYMTFFI